MENQPYRVCGRACGSPKRWCRLSEVSRVESFTVADLPILGKPSRIPAAELAPAALPVRSARAVNHLMMMKTLGPAVARRERLPRMNSVRGDFSLAAAALQTPMRTLARRVSVRVEILCKGGGAPVAYFTLSPKLSRRERPTSARILWDEEGSDRVCVNKYYPRGAQIFKRTKPLWDPFYHEKDQGDSPHC